MPASVKENKDPVQNPDVVGRSKNIAPKVGLIEPSPLEKLPFQLQSGEKIIRELKPQFLGFMVTRAFGSYMSITATAIIILFIAIFAHLIIEGLVLGVYIILPLLIIVSIIPFIQYGKSWYWITTRRVVGKRGLLGYSIDSIPLEQITDVVLDRTLLDRLLGLSSLIIVPMGGSAKVNGGSPNEQAMNANFFPALPQEVARELQRVLFNLRDEVKHTQITQPAEGASTPPSAEVAQEKSHFARGTK
jgi:uncharacterized membrane protein YdbT with pleckstrin-like domain